MKYIAMLGLVLAGFIGHKALEEVYDYKFEQSFASDECVEVYTKAIAMNEDACLTKRFQCTYKQMGAYDDLKYVLARPHFSDDTGNRWYY